MKKVVHALAAAASLAAADSALATPSTTFWTPATTYTQPFLVPHLTYDSYVAERGMLQNDYGLTVGFLPFEKVQGEIGVDFFYSGFTQDWFQANGKLTLVEDAVWSWSPALSVGITNAGFKKDVSDYHLLHATLGKTTPIGLFGVGGYYGAGSKVLWTNSAGSVERGGFMASWVSPDLVLNLPGLNKIVLLADYSSGKNWFGAVGGGLAVYFTPAIDVITGPVFFTDKTFYRDTYGTDWMWTVQLDVDFDLRKAVPAAPKT
jgi:hypothetical protein